MLAVHTSATLAAAQTDWALISTPGDPDPVTAFDLADPGNSNLGIGFVDGNFHRGMDFDTHDSFYYFVSTDSLNDPGDRGLWCWNSGANFQLAPIGFSDNGDATAGDSLDAYTDLGGSNTLVEIGGTGMSQFIGLAMGPSSGLLYGYDSSTESLYTISTTDASVSLVGASGRSLGAIGGMDFSADGSTLLFSAGGDLYLVDKSNGGLSAAGDVVLNVSALSYRVPAPGSAALLALAGLAAARRRR